MRITTLLYEGDVAVAILGTCACQLSSADEVEGFIQKAWGNSRLRVVKLSHTIGDNDFSLMPHNFSVAFDIKAHVTVEAGPDQQRKQSRAAPPPATVPASFDEEYFSDSEQNDEQVFERTAGRLQEASVSAILRERTKGNAACLEATSIALNNNLSSFSIHDVLSGKDCKSLHEQLMQGESFDQNVLDRNRFKRKLGNILLDHCDKRYSPRPDEVRKFVAHLCDRFPSVNQKVYVGNCKSILFEFIYNKKQQLKKNGLHSTREYRKRRILRSEHTIEEQAELNAELQDSADSPLADRLVDATRQFRLMIIKEKGVAAACNVIRQLHSPSLILRDFEVSEGIALVPFQTKWDRVQEAVACLTAATTETRPRSALESLVTLEGEDGLTHLTMIRIMVLLRNQDPRKRVSRLSRIFIEMPDEPDASCVISQLAKMSLSDNGKKKKAQTQPAVVRYGRSRTQFGVFIQGNEIVCSEGLLHAVLVCLASHYVFHLKWDPEVSDAWLVILLLIGLPTWDIKSNVGRSVAKAIDATIEQL